MNTEVKKLTREPLVWIGAILLCVPLLASSSLNKLRNSLTYESDSNSVVNSFDAGKVPEVGLNASINGSMNRESNPTAQPIKMDHDFETPISAPLPPMPRSDDELTTDLPAFDSMETPPISLPSSMPELAMADPKPEPGFDPGLDPGLDPGSLLEMGDEIYPDDEDEPRSSKKTETTKSKADAAPESAADEEGFDFLFGEDSGTEEESKDTASSQDQDQIEDQSITQDSITQDSMPSGLEPNVQDPAEAQSPDWLFSDSDSQAVTPPEPFVPPTTETPNLGWAHEAASPEVYSEPLVSPPPIALEPAPAPMISPETESYSEHYVQLDSGPADWWTPYCQQSLWNTVPAQQTGLDAIVFAAMQNSPYVKLLNTEPQIAETTILEADSAYDWSAFVDSSWNDTNRAVVSLLDTGTAGGRFVQQQLLFESGVKKNLRTGGHLRVGHAWQRTDNNSSFLSPPDQATAQILLDYRQPLLRGAGRQVNSSQVMLAQLNFESSQNNSQALLQQFIVDVVSEYWELHYARGVLMQKLRSVEMAEQLMAELSSFPNAESRRRDLARIEAVAIARRTDLIRANSEVAMRQEKLLNLTFGTSMPDSGSMEVVPVEAPGSFMVPHDLAYVTEMAVQNRAEVKVALGAIRASAVRQNLVLNDLKPRLDAIVSTFLSGVDDDKDVSGAFGDSLDYNPSYSVGVSFEVPLGRRNANARISRQQLEYQRLQYQLEQTLGNVRLDARLALRNVSSIAKELENQKLAVAQASREMQYATGQAANGVSKSADNTSFLIDDLMRSQEGLATAESRLLRSQTDLSVALVQLKRATGQLLQTAPMPQISDFSVQQASYEQPTYEQPIYDQSTYGQTSYDQSTFEQPTYGQPIQGQPMNGQPMQGQPEYGQPIEQQPTQQQPATKSIPWPTAKEGISQKDAESVWAAPSTLE